MFFLNGTSIAFHSWDIPTHEIPMKSPLVDGLPADLFESDVAGRTSGASGTRPGHLFSARRFKSNARKHRSGEGEKRRIVLCEMAHLLSEMSLEP